MELTELLRQQERQQEDTIQADAEEAFQATFDIQGLDVRREGNIIYFVTDIDNRIVRINPLLSPMGVDWQLNGTTVVYASDMNKSVEERQQMLARAILQLPQRRPEPPQTPIDAGQQPQPATPPDAQVQQPTTAATPPTQAQAQQPAAPATSVTQVLPQPAPGSPGGPVSNQ